MREHTRESRVLQILQGIVDLLNKMEDRGGLDTVLDPIPVDTTPEEDLPSVSAGSEWADFPTEDSPVETVAPEESVAAAVVEEVKDLRPKGLRWLREILAGEALPEDLGDLWDRDLDRDTMSLGRSEYGNEEIDLLATLWLDPKERAEMESAYRRHFREPASHRHVQNTMAPESSFTQIPWKQTPVVKGDSQEEVQVASLTKTWEVSAKELSDLWTPMSEAKIEKGLREIADKLGIGTPVTPEPATKTTPPGRLRQELRQK